MLRQGERFAEKAKEKVRTQAEQATSHDMNKYPLISVLVLCYRNSALLKEMLKSIFDQNYSNIQLIVSDDGSADFDVEGTRAFIEENAGTNITNVIVRKNAVNMGTVRHITEALSYAKGQYVVFTAADDRFNNTSAFSIYTQQFKQHPKHLWLVAQCNILTPDYKKSIYVTPTNADLVYFHEGDALRLFSRWCRRGMAVPCSMAFRREAFEAVGGIDQDYCYLEDWPLVLKLLRQRHAPIFVNEITAVHSTGGVTNSNACYGIEIREKFFKDKETLMRKEVEPHLDLLSTEDLAAYKLYRREVMEYNYFLDITWPTASQAKKLKLLLIPKHFLWMLEKIWPKFAPKFHRKYMTLLSHALFLSSAAFFIFAKLLSFKSKTFACWIFTGIGYFDAVLAGILIITAFASVPLDWYCKKKRQKRLKLVN